MGGCQAKDTTISDEEIARNKAIDKIIRQDMTNQQKEIKLLLLGAGQSGKSTLAKQMKVLYLSGFTSDERSAYKEIVFSNIHTNVIHLINGARLNGLELSPQTMEILRKSWIGDETEPMNKEIANDIKILWADPAIQKVFTEELVQIEDSTPYFFDSENLDRYQEPDFVPNESDILRVRVKTTGITEIAFELSNYRYKMMDVGGQRSERRKWIHCFQDVKAVIFFVAMSEYTQYLEEDPTVNRMHESIALFDEIVNSCWFQNSSIILFLNKSDLFQEKIKKYDLKELFEDYTGGHDFDAGCKFLSDLFVNLVRERGDGTRQIYSHVTCATNTNNIKLVFSSVNNMLLKEIVGTALPGIQM